LAGIIGTTWQAVRAGRRAEGERLEKERAEANFALAGEVVEKYLVTVTDDPELMRTEFIGLRRKLLESAVPFFQKIVAQKSDDPQVQSTRALAYARLALVHLALGEYEAAKQDSEAMRAIFTRLTVDFPNNPAYLHGLANSERNLATALRNLGMHEEAEAGYGRALAIMKQLTDESPTEAHRKELAHGYRDLGMLLQRNAKMPEAEAAYYCALRIQEELADDFPDNPEYLGAQAACHNNIGLMFDELGKDKEAEEAYRRSIEILDQIAARFSTYLAAVRDYSAQYMNLANLLSRLERYEEAVAYYLRALDTLEASVKEFPSPPRRIALSDCYNCLGSMQAQKGEYEQAAASFESALGICKKLVEEFPNVPEYRCKLSISHNALGNALSSLGKFSEAEPEYRKAMEIDEKLVFDYPDVSDYGVSLGGAYCNFGTLLIDSGQPEASLKWFERAITQLDAVLGMEPRLYDAREFLRNSHGGRADAFFELGRHDDALESQEKAMALTTEMLGPSHPDRIRRLYKAINNYEITGRFDRALQLRKEMLALRLQTLGPDDPETLGAMADVAIEYCNLGRYEEAVKQREEALALMNDKIPDHPYTFITMSNLAGTYANLGRYKEALELRQETLELRKANLGIDHADTLSSMHELSATLIACDQGAAAVPLIDECFSLASGKTVDPSLIPGLIELRLRHFEKQKDASGCRATAQMWEGLNRSDAGSLYAASCYRSVTAAVLRATDMSDAADETAQSATEEGDRAMDWLAKAVAAGFTDVAHINEDKDLDPLRERDDFKELLANLQAKQE
jgi:tetratricopeptide (TPR) repeat protein